MKSSYFAPTIEVIEIDLEDAILSLSINGYDPTDPTESIVAGINFGD